MKTNRSTLRTMRLVILICQLGLILQTEAQLPTPCIGSVTNRPPENTDITVNCSTRHMDVSIYICPVYHSLYNESLMVLNNVLKTNECMGTPDWSVVPPVLRFKIPINETSVSACNSVYEVTSETGTGEFADFSNVQFIKISGTINSNDPAASMITYRPQILYKFSCRYPMQYLLNNTEVAVSGVNVAIKDNNGSFISTLSFQLYRDNNYTQRLSIPQTGLSLKTKIYVQVQANNLTNRFNVLLDRCFATPSPYPNSNNSYDLFVGCTREPQTTVDLNGKDQKARFNFEAFRFVEHKNKTVSTFYIHCITRLCDVSSCSTLLNCGPSNRRKREAPDVSANTTVTSEVIRVGTQNNDDSPSNLAAPVSADGSSYSSPVVAVIVCIIILAIVLIAMAVYLVLYMRRIKPFME